MYQFWYSLLKYCCTHKYCKIWDNEHKRGIKHTKMVIVGVSMCVGGEEKMVVTNINWSVCYDVEDSDMSTDIV